MHSQESKIIEEIYLTVQLILLLFLLNESFPMFTDSGHISLKIFTVLFTIYYFMKLIRYFVVDVDLLTSDHYMPNRVFSSIDGFFLCTFIYMYYQEHHFPEGLYYLYLIIQSIRYPISSTLFFASLTALLYTLNSFLLVEVPIALGNHLTTITLFYVIAFIISFALRQMTSLQKERQYYYDALNTKNKVLEKLATTDYLTSLKNHQSFYTYYDALIRQSKNKLFPISLALIDIDNFKSINDTYGHLVGDAVLKNLAHVLTSEIRKTDYAARYGGEEFAILFPDTSLDDAITLSERLRSAVEEHSFVCGETQLRVTVSIGVDAFNPGRDSLDPHLFINNVDTLLYKAKEKGKNQLQYPLQNFEV